MNLSKFIIKKNGRQIIFEQTLQQFYNRGGSHALKNDELFSYKNNVFVLI